MTDLDERFRALRDVRPPDLWPEIERRRPPRRHVTVPWGRLIAAAVALLTLAAAVLVAPRVFRGERETRPASDFPEGWTELPVSPDPHPGAAAVWTGTEVFVWGGCSPDGEDECRPTADGFAFDPAERTWRALPPAPEPGEWSGALWTGREALFFTEGRDALHGQAFDPASGSWRGLPPAPVRAMAVRVWTGTEVLVWGGGQRDDPENVQGAAYDPVTDAWRRLPDAPVGLNLASGAWTGQEMLVFGSLLSNRNIAETPTSVGAAYTPATDAWRELPPSDLSPQATSARWIDGRLVAWDYEVRAQEYDPVTNAWTEPVDMPLEFDECYPDSTVVGGRLFAFFCGQAALYDPATSSWREVQGGPLGERIEGLRLWRFAQLVPAGDVTFLLMQGITLGRKDEPCYGCPGYPISFWVYRPGEETTEPPGEGSSRPADLWGRTFVSVASDGVTEDGEPRPLRTEDPIEVTFEDRGEGGVVRWQAGCNTFGASVEITSERLVLGEIEGTDAGCAGVLHDQDDWLAGFFGSDPYWELDGERLTLTSGGTDLMFEPAD